MTPLHNMPTILSVLTLTVSAWLVGEVSTSNLFLGQLYAQETQPEVTERGVPFPTLGVGPDLVPLIVPPPNPTSSVNKQCPRQDPGQGRTLHFVVKNQGNAAAPTSVAVGLFNADDSQPVPVLNLPPVGVRIKALAPNESTPVDIVIPNGCFASNCRWAFHVDVAYEVAERVEKNNAISGLCGG